MENLSKAIDHTFLKPEATPKQITQICEEARHYQFATVCVNPTWVSLAALELEDHPTGICTVIGFPLGANTSEIKAFETQKAIQEGASEVDMVMNIGALKSGDQEKVINDIRSVTHTAGNALVKVIIETCLLNDDEKVLACQLTEKAGAHFVKTSTGFSSGGATLNDIKLMRQSVSTHISIKASGNIRDRKTALQMLKAGASRLGTSSGVQILQDKGPAS